MSETRKDTKKIAVIGAGIAGLTAGIYGELSGYDVHLYEQHSIAGGECTGWNRQGYYIDNCAHWMMGSKPGTDLHQIWLQTGALGPQTKMHREEKMYTSRLGNQEAALWADIDRTERELIALSPEDEKQIRRLLKYCRLAENIEIPAKVPSELMKPMEGLKLLAKTGPLLKIQKEYKGQNIEDLANRFKHPLIRALISDFTPLDTSASSFAMAYGNFVSGDGGIPAGGSRAMAQRMKERFEMLGGKLFTGIRIIRLVPAGGKVSGIETEDGQFIEYDYIIPACDASVTFGTLLPESFMSSLMKEMFENRKAYPVYNTFQCAFAVDLAEDPLDGEVMLDTPELVFQPGFGDRLTVKSYSYEPDFAPPGRQIIQTLHGGSEILWPFWQELGKNPEKYRETKKKWALQTQQTLEERFPVLKGRLTLLDVWTPLTYNRYCSAYKGFYQSCMISKDSAAIPYPPALVQGLDNVVLAGQWISPPGGLPGSAITGKQAVQRILNKDGKDFHL